MGDGAETVCLLSKLNAKQHIEVEIKMDELDLTAAESKATYEEIKAYVLEHSGMKVSSLYIAQVKQKCGIIERENYNKPKSEDAKQPQCPPEKEKAIMEALKHFGMLQNLLRRIGKAKAMKKEKVRHFGFLCFVMSMAWNILNNLLYLKSRYTLTIPVL